ncbi:MAG: hypothetical protein NC453_22930 [Muribaculum sp.]|nr:hypothetical protein [Muribaculum sp.]
MDSLYKDIVDEIQKLRQLKQSVFEEDFSQCDITASNICLSADILLLPLYWYITLTQHNVTQPMEEYMRASVSTFDQRAALLIPRIIERTRELDNQYISKPFRQYRNLLKKCFPQYTINSNQK